MMFPRMIALAERAWHRDAFENTTVQPTREWEKFSNKLGYRELPRLDKAGTKYRISPPGVA